MLNLWEVCCWVLVQLLSETEVFNVFTSKLKSWHFWLISSVQTCAVTWDWVLSELMQEPLFTFQMRMWRSLVPPPDAGCLAAMSTRPKRASTSKREFKGQFMAKERQKVFQVRILTLTAPWCSLQQWTAWLWLPTPPSCKRGHTYTKLSLPPLARYRLSRDHCSPHTPWEWPVSMQRWWSANLMSGWWMCPVFQPLGREISKSEQNKYTELQFCLFYQMKQL